MTSLDKVSGLLLSLANYQQFDGEFFRLRLDENHIFLKENQIKFDECHFYFSTLKNINWIAITSLQTTNAGTYAAEFSLTFEGIKQALLLQSEGITSNNCFVAMSFRNETKAIRQAIKNAIFSTGFNAILIDELHHDSVQPINDAIITALKKSRFCFADFNNQASGVYYESGFVAGQSKKVIYCCQQDHFQNSHFDTNNCSPNKFIYGYS